jgi:hypothetical protein
MDPLPHMPSWCNAQLLKHSDNFYINDQPVTINSQYIFSDDTGVIIAYPELAHFENIVYGVFFYLKQKQTPWFQSASELYRPSDRRLSAKFTLNKWLKANKLVLNFGGGEKYIQFATKNNACLGLSIGFDNNLVEVVANKFLDL